MTRPLIQKCDQCGRSGTRGFKWLGNPRGVRGVDFFVLCANQRACRKRWPVESEDRRDARLA